MASLVSGKIKSKLTSEKGYIGAAAVATIAILVVLGAGLSSLIISEMLNIVHYQNNTRAYYLAKAGVHHALHNLNDDNSATTGTIDPPVDLGQGSYRTEYDPDSGVLRSYGVVGSSPEITKTISVVLKPMEYEHVEEFDDQEFEDTGSNVQWGYDPINNTGIPGQLTLAFSPASGNNQMNPDAAMDSEGNIFVVWQDNRHGNWDIYISKVNLEFDSDSVVELWSQAGVRVNRDNTNQDQTNPRLALDEDDNVFVVWQDERGGNWDIYAAKIDPEWGGLSWDFRVDDDTGTRDQEKPDIAFSQKTGETATCLYVAWQDRRDQPPVRARIYAQKLDPDGTDRDSARQWGADKQVNVSSGDPGSCENPAVAADSLGNVYFAWQYKPPGAGKKYWDIYARKLDWGGNWGWTADLDVQRVSGVSGDYEGKKLDNIEPRVVADDSGNSYYAWERWFKNGSEDLKAFVQKLKSDGQRQPWNGSYDLEVGCSDPDIELIGGYIYIPQKVLYCSIHGVNHGNYINGPYTIKTQKLDPSNDSDPVVWKNGAGEPESKFVPALLGACNGFDQRAPVVVGNSSDQMYYIWQDERNGDWDIYARRFDDPDVSSTSWPQDREAGSEGGQYQATGSALSKNVNIKTSRPIDGCRIEIYQASRGSQYTFKASSNGGTNWGTDQVLHSHGTAGSETFNLGTVDVPYSFPVPDSDLIWTVNPIDLNTGSECSTCQDLPYNNEQTPAIDRVVITFWAGAALDYSTWRSN